MSNMVAKLKTMSMELPEEFVVHLIFASLPKDFEPFEINYKSQPDVWDLEKLIAMIVQEEERIKERKSQDLVNHVQGHKKKKFFQSPTKPSFKSQGQPSRSPYEGKGKGKVTQVDKDTYMHCGEKGHYQKDCIQFLKWLNKNGKNLVIDEIIFIEEFLYIDYSPTTWWIESDATVHVANSLQGFAMRRILARGERRIKVANDKEVEVEAIGTTIIIKW